MRRVAVLGPNPPCGSLSVERFVELLSDRIGLEAFSLRPLPGLVLASSDDTVLPFTSRDEERGYRVSRPPVVNVEADTLIWLRFAPRAYLRDWLAGWLDVLLNGRAGLRRHAQRAGLWDVVRACGAMLHENLVEGDRFEFLRPHLLVLELSSPEQALFWLEMQEERVRETIPPCG
jgi:hypothetical protein